MFKDPEIHFTNSSKTRLVPRTIIRINHGNNSIEFVDAEVFQSYNGTEVFLRLKNALEIHLKNVTETKIDCHHAKSSIVVDYINIQLTSL